MRGLFQRFHRQAAHQCLAQLPSALVAGFRDSVPTKQEQITSTELNRGLGVIRSADDAQGRTGHGLGIARDRAVGPSPYMVRTTRNSAFPLIIRA
jgi:hypothetical protein